MEQDKFSIIESELLELKVRARNVEYKNVIPRLPKNIRNKSITHQESLLSGFKKRLSNWKKGLLILESPGGLIYEWTTKTSTKLEEATANLIKHFNVNNQ